MILVIVYVSSEFGVVANSWSSSSNALMKNVIDVQIYSVFGFPSFWGVETEINLNSR